MGFRSFFWEEEYRGGKRGQNNDLVSALVEKLAIENERLIFRTKYK
jgi:hypothetical protein